MLAAFVGSSAVGYAPMAPLQLARAVRAPSAVMGVSDLVGVSTETGGKVWDPLGLSDKMDEENLNLIRAAELKHCRIAMLATSGIITQSQLTGGGFPYTYSGTAADFIPPLAWTTLPGICASGLGNGCV